MSTSEIVPLAELEKDLEVAIVKVVFGQVVDSPGNGLVEVGAPDGSRQGPLLTQRSLKGGLGGEQADGGGIEGGEDPEGVFGVVDVGIIQQVEILVGGPPADVEGGREIRQRQHAGKILQRSEQVGFGHLRDGVDLPSAWSRRG